MARNKSAERNHIEEWLRDLGREFTIADVQAFCGCTYAKAKSWCGLMRDAHEIRVIRKGYYVTTATIATGNNG